MNIKVIEYIVLGAIVVVLVTTLIYFPQSLLPVHLR